MSSITQTQTQNVPGSINLNELPPVENLLATRSQVEKDLQLLSESFGQLKGAQSNFATSIQSLESLHGSEGKRALVPLTNSVYVDADLVNCDRVLVDIGTGYYIEQVQKIEKKTSTEKAKNYYEKKVEYVQEQLNKLAPTIQEKRSMVQVLTQLAQQKLNNKQ